MPVTLHRTVVLAALLASAGTAAADDGDAADGPPVPHHAITVGGIGYGGRVAGVPEGGWGVDTELSLGQGRYQLFVEGAVMGAILGEDTDRRHGLALRGAGGVRWLARTFEVNPGAVLDMHLEAFGGAVRVDVEDTDPVLRPELGVGVGYQVRKLSGRHLGFRLSARLWFSPTSKAMATAVCRGSCPTAGYDASSGLAVVFGVQF
jgi:hypothetical protein